ncbi:MAG: hypothetical protein HY553_18085 [Elusimicrobia bacterium]|nr:hypothetical protein [Elusimicrobiota bacterium]
MGRRLATSITLLSLLCGLGAAQRSWHHRCVAEAEKAEAAGRAVAEEYRAQLARFQSEVARLPPDGRAIVDDLLRAQGQTMMVNPLMRSLARFSPAKDETLEERVLLGAQAVNAAWTKASRWLVRGLWLLVVGLAVYGIGGIALGRLPWATGAGKASSAFARLWLLAVGYGAAALFAASGLNGWRAMPVAFYAAPAVALLLALFFLLQEAPEADPVLAELGETLVAPAASALVVTLFAFVG